MRQFDKGELGRIARQYGFVRDTFEKVIRLTDIFVSGEYKPELLFDNPLILENIGNHPMPEWKRLNMR